MAQTDLYPRLCNVLRGRPDAWARVSGSEEYPRVRGTVRFFQTRRGVLVAAEVAGLPREEGCCGSSIFGFHIHSGSCCTGDREDPFEDVQGHYDPRDCPHPAHAGDLPPLFANDGYAFQVFLTDSFSVRDIIGRTVIIHDSVDDFTSQPGGNAGVKIACGEIRGMRSR